MRDCLIFGTGRSGTSMLAGILHEAGYFLGDRLHVPRDSNPKGFFEWFRINRINEALLARHDRPGLIARAAGLFGKHTVTMPGENQRWLALLPAGAEVRCGDSSTEDEIRSVLERRPFCYKDPRFCYTVPAWRPQLPPRTALVCIVRDPSQTAASIVKECRSQSYLADLLIGRATALRVWSRMYRAVLDDFARDPSAYVFVHYEQVLDGSALPRLSDALDAELVPGFADAALRRSVPSGRVPHATRQLYARLCALAGYDSAR